MKHVIMQHKNSFLANIFLRVSLLVRAGKIDSIGSHQKDLGFMV